MSSRLQLPRRPSRAVGPGNRLARPRACSGRDPVPPACSRSGVVGGPDRHSFPPNRPGVQIRQPEDGPHRRGLAGTVRAEEPHDLARRHRKAQIVEGGQRAEPAAQTVELQQVGHEGAFRFCALVRRVIETCSGPGVRSADGTRVHPGWPASLGHSPDSLRHPPSVVEGTAQQHIDLGIETAELVCRPSGQGIMDSWIDPKEYLLAITDGHEQSVPVF